MTSPEYLSLSRCRAGGCGDDGDDAEAIGGQAPLGEQLQGLVEGSTGGEHGFANHQMEVGGGIGQGVC